MPFHHRQATVTESPLGLTGRSHSEDSAVQNGLDSAECQEFLCDSFIGGPSIDLVISADVMESYLLICSLFVCLLF